MENPQLSEGLGEDDEVCLSKLRVNYSGQYRRFKYCHRTHANEYIRRALFKGEDCPDVSSIWERV